MIDSIRCKSDLAPKDEKCIEDIMLKVLHEHLIRQVKKFLDLKVQTLSVFYEYSTNREIRY